MRRDGTRWIWAQGILAAGVLLAGFGVIVAGSAAPSVTLAGPEVLRLVQQAPAALSSYAALRMTGQFTYTFGGHTIKASFAGLSTPDGQLGTATVAIPAVGKKFTILTVNHMLYVSVPPASIPGGAHFAGCRLPTGSGGLGVGTGGPDPLAYLRLMPGATGGVRVVGHKTIDGEPTTEYEVQVDIAQALQRLEQEGRASSSVSVQELRQAGVTTMPYDVWIDTQRAVRQFGFRLSLHAFTMKVQFRLSGATTAPDVREPAANDVWLTPNCNEIGRLAAQ